MIGDLVSRRGPSAQSFPHVSNLSRIEGASSDSIVHFSVDGRDFKEGAIRRGGRLTIDYDVNRLQALDMDGHGAWDVVAHALFHPGGQLYRGSLMSPRQDVRRISSFEITVPHDATKVELWFYSVSRKGQIRWDSRDGRNYIYMVDTDALGTMRHAVQYRQGAIANAGIVNVSGDLAFNKDLSPGWGHRLHSNGLGMKTILLTRAWVRNVSPEKKAWIDVHVFGRDDELLHAETFGLRYLQPAEGGGDFFVFDGIVHHGSHAAEAHLIQYRLYSDAGGTVHTDGLLHTLRVLDDEQSPSST
jgi:hypothetical protein